MIPWAGYARTYQQYRNTFIPLVVLHLDLDTPRATSASSMIDHVFGTCYGISRRQQCEELLRMLSNECGAFTGVGKVKQMAAKPGRSTGISPPNIEAAFEDFRQNKPAVYEQPMLPVLGAGLDPDTQTKRDSERAYAEAPLMSDQWLSLPMPDHADFIDPLSML